MEWLLTPVFLPGEFHVQRSLAGSKSGTQLRNQTNVDSRKRKFKNGRLHPTTVDCELFSSAHGHCLRETKLQNTKQVSTNQINYLL